MGSIGVPEMIFIFVLALLIFGPKKLPELGRSLGKGIFEFRRASSELRNTLEREMSNIEQETKAEEQAKLEEKAKQEEQAKQATADAGKDSAKAVATQASNQGSYEYEGYSGERHA